MEKPNDSIEIIHKSRQAGKTAQTVEYIMDYAKELGRAQETQIEEYDAWCEYITPQFKEKYGLHYQSSLSHLYSLETQRWLHDKASKPMEDIFLYNRALKLCYGSREILLDTMQASLFRYNQVEVRTEKVQNRIDNYTSIISLGTL